MTTKLLKTPSFGGSPLSLFARNVPFHHRPTLQEKETKRRRVVNDPTTENMDLDTAKVCFYTDDSMQMDQSFEELFQVILSQVQNPSYGVLLQQFSARNIVLSPEEKAQIRSTVACYWD